MFDGRIPIWKDLYGEFVTWSRPTGRPYLHYEDTWKSGTKMADVNTTSWEIAAAARPLETDR